MPYYLGLLNGEEELSGEGYQRQLLSGFNFDYYQNEGLLQFPEAASEWGRITHFGIYNRPEEGEALLRIPATNPCSVGEDTVVRILPRQITVSGVEGVQEDPEPVLPPCEPKSWQERLGEDLF